MLQIRFLPALIRKQDITMNSIIFCQEGAPPHMSNDALEFLRWPFHCSPFIFRRTDNSEPPYSPDLYPPDFFPWRSLKAKDYENNPHTLWELKNNIRWKNQTCTSSSSQLSHRQLWCPYGICHPEARYLDWVLHQWLMISLPIVEAFFCQNKQKCNWSCVLWDKTKQNWPIIRKHCS